MVLLNRPYIPMKLAWRLRKEMFHFTVRNKLLEVYTTLWEEHVTVTFLTVLLAIGCSTSAEKIN
jgi:hypothetical protein